ncbi:hypothetical protein HK102_007326 [Quaeritorhiza haematococci]|nr:hypothetical protein HK102_007326 [Quaeritorhiza haematococci]
MRVDSVRVLYLHKYGGVYADLDVESTGSLEDMVGLGGERWMEGHVVAPPQRNGNNLHGFSWASQQTRPTPFHQDQGVVLASMGPTHLIHTWPHAIPNAWMASRPGHSFWMHCIKRMMEKMETARQNGGLDRLGAEDATGPVMLHEAYEEYVRGASANREPIYLLAPNVIFPYSWDHNRTHTWVCSSQSPNFNAQDCKSEFVTPGSTLAISYWSHSWGDKGNKLIEEAQGLGSKD